MAPRFCFHSLLRYFFHLQRSRLLARFCRNQREPKHLVQRLHRMELENVPYVLGHVLDVSLVPLRNDDDFDARPVSAKHFFLEAANWQHASPKSDLTRHRHILAHWTVCHLRYKRRRNRNSRGRTVLRNCPSWNVDVCLDRAKPVTWNPEFGSVVRRVGERCASRLFHDVAQLPCKNE